MEIAKQVEQRLQNNKEKCKNWLGKSKNISKRKIRKTEGVVIGKKIEQTSKKIFAEYYEH